MQTEADSFKLFFHLFLGLTFSGNSLKTQIYVTTIISLLCQTKRDQMELLDAYAIPNLVRLINIENEHLQIPVLRCLCRMSFENRSVSDNICVTRLVSQQHMHC